MLKKFFAVLFLGAVLCGCSSWKTAPLAKSFTLHRIFGEHMVLQCGRPIVFSGTAEPGHALTVSFAGKNVRVTTDAQGEWSAAFPAMKAGKTPYTLKVSGEPHAIPVICHDILIGEVWLCSGQSNMEMPVWSRGPFWRIGNADEEVKNANHPMIRFWQGLRRPSPFEEQSEPAGAGWQICSPATIRPFSATAYCFGRALQKELNVPVGLIHVSWGGTKIQPWISPGAIEKNAIQPEAGQRVAGAAGKRNKAVLQRLQKEYETKRTEWRKAFFDEDSFAAKEALNWLKPDFDDSRWAAMPPRGAMPDGKQGIAVFRATLTLPPACAGKDLVLNLGPIDDTDDTYFNGVRIGGVNDLNHPRDYWSFPRTYTVPGRLVKAGKNVIAVRVADFGGEGGFTNAEAISFLQDGKKLNVPCSWKAAMVLARDGAFLAKRPAAPQSQINHQFPGTLYNGMVAPWTRLAIRGVIWYQGCSNAGDMRYYQLHKLLIEDWRTQFKNPKMPFVLVQLAGFDRHTPKDRPPEDSWMHKAPLESPAYAITREIQSALLDDPKVGMTVAMDVGNQFDIHPRDKQTVGKRLCAEAMRTAYGKKGISQGPKFRSFKVENGSVRVCFDNVGKGLTTKDGKAPGAFALKDAKGQLCWAQAKIDGDTVVVSSPMVENPVAVRYAFCGYRGDVNLMNKDGFAAIPFRSDAQKYPLEKKLPLKKAIQKIGEKSHE